MKKYLLLISTALLMLASCGKGGRSSGNYPEDFDKQTDLERVSYMMQQVSPDSLARFVIDGALGRNPGAPIDSLAMTTLYIYEHLRDEDLDAFSVQYDNYVESLPLNDKMKVYMLAGSEDPQGLGYKLGLEYLSSIRENNKNADQIEKELKAFRKACGTDTATYRRFIIGFHTVLAVDSGKDLAQDIYTRFINYE